MKTQRMHKKAHEKNFPTWKIVSVDGDYVEAVIDCNTCPIKHKCTEGCY